MSNLSRAFTGVLPAAAAGLVLFPRRLAAAEGEPGLFSLNLGLYIWTIVVFLVVLAVLRRFAWGPILGAVESREKSIQSAIDEAARLREEAMELLEEHRRQLADSRRQSQQILAEAREAGEQLRRQIEEKARSEGEAMISRARDEIEREKKAALDELRRESVELALAAAGRLVQQKLDAQADRAIIEAFLDEVSSSAAGGGA